MFVKIDAEEALKHVGSFAHIKSVDGEHIFKGKLFIHPDFGISIKFGKGDSESEPSFVELHPLVLGEQELLLWAAPGEPDYSLLEGPKSEANIPPKESVTEVDSTDQTTDSDKASPSESNDDATEPTSEVITPDEVPF